MRSSTPPSSSPWAEPSWLRLAALGWLAAARLGLAGRRRASGWLAAARLGLAGRRPASSWPAAARPGLAGRRVSGQSRGARGEVEGREERLASEREVSQAVPLGPAESAGRVHSEY